MICNLLLLIKKQTTQYDQTIIVYNRGCWFLSRHRPFSDANHMTMGHQNSVKNKYVCVQFCFYTDQKAYYYCYCKLCARCPWSRTFSVQGTDADATLTSVICVETEFPGTVEFSYIFGLIWIPNFFVRSRKFDFYFERHTEKDSDVARETIHPSVFPEGISYKWQNIHTVIL